mgnify:CR=1 FL=1
MVSSLRSDVAFALSSGATESRLVMTWGAVAAGKPPLVMQPLLAESAQRHAQQESEIRRQLDIVWSQQRDPVLAAGELDDELLPRVGRVIHSCIADQFRLQMKQGASTRGRLAMQRLVDANAAALHLSQTSQANLRLLAETQLIEWARTGRLLTQN